MQASRTKISDIISNIFKESIDSVKKKSMSTLNEAEDKGTEPEKEEKVYDDKTIDKEEAEKLEKGEIAVDDVVEKLNAIRAGKSYKDEEILRKLTSYVDSLDKAEKTALLGFLKALSQIVTGEVPTKDVVKPSDKPVDVKIEKETQKITVKPTVIKKQSPESDKEKTPAEDTKGPVPIVAKKK